MSEVGYSGSPLAKKLGLNDCSRVRFVGEPPGFIDLLAPLPAVEFVGSDAVADVVVSFVRSQAALVTALELRESISTSGALWIAWPKKSSGVHTDMTEDVIRHFALPLGLVDNKVCAINATWSGLRLVWRLTSR